jgi:hypothetical protein
MIPMRSLYHFSASALAHWLAPAFAAGFSLAANLDKVEALSPDHASVWDRVTRAPLHAGDDRQRV